MSAREFTIDVPQAAVEDLHRRLHATRFPEVPPNDDWSRGTSGEYLRELIGAWAELDWSAAQDRLNELPQKRVRVDDLDLHTIDRRSHRADAIPLLLVHGWPDSAFRFRKVVDPLADPSTADDPAFHVVAPSLPGFGWSGHEARSADDTADAFAALMTELGHDRFVVSGGDVGTGVGLALARRHPDRVVGLLLTNADYPTGQEDDLTDEEAEYAAWIGQWWQSQGAYAMLQSTKPQTVGPALVDSPAGLAAFLISLIETGAEQHDVEAAFGGLDELLINLSIYWFTATGASAADTYRVGATWGAQERVEVPTGFAIFPREAPSPREWCERGANVVRFTRMPRGGHFAALEVPDDYAAELRAFVGDLPAG